MPTPAPTSQTTPRVDDQFLDLICSDPDLLAAEFDAIIAAEWREPPADKPGHSVGGKPPDSGPARRADNPVRRAICRPRHPGIGGWARQRSPPL